MNKLRQGHYVPVWLPADLKCKLEEFAVRTGLIWNGRPNISAAARAVITLGLSRLETESTHDVEEEGDVQGVARTDE